VTDFLDETRREIDNRLKELKPAVEEYNRLEAAAAALAGVGGSSRAATSKRRRGPGRPRGSTKRTATATASTTKTRTKRKAKAAAKPRRAGRKKGSGTRAAEASALVKGQPGITIPELAAKMGIKQNYLYRVLPGLEQDGKVVKRGRGWFPKG
jgi:hypothetical protein